MVKYKTKRAARKAAKRIGLRGIHSHGRGKNKVYMAGSSHAAFVRAKKRKKK